MRIASITMIGQFPDGIDLHVRNLKWALTNQDHIFIITSSSFIERFNLKDDNQVTYIPFHLNSNVKFINFWNEFPVLIKRHNIKPEWFLFMEEDIWFFAKPSIKNDPNLIQSFLCRGEYRNIMLNNDLLHSRVWEGSQLIHGDIIRNAIDFGINFSFVNNTFVDQNREKYESQFGGKISMSMYQKPDTFDEFGLYCALVQKTNVEHEVKSVHLRGPESMHRLYPDVYHFATKERLKEIQKKLPYIDTLLVVACYYLAGLWKKIEHLDWTKTQKESMKEIERVLRTGKEWLTAHEYDKLNYLWKLMNGPNS